MNNLDYFEISKNTPETLFDPFYKKSKIVIPADCGRDNELTKKHNKLIECITAFKVLTAKKRTSKDEAVAEIVNEIVDILSNTPNINYSPFSQFFFVYNSTFSYFLGLGESDKFDFVYDMLLKYCKERHDMYLSHGYSNSILQVICDNYSHKRNGKTSIEKILSILKPYGLKKISTINEIKDNTYFLPDKGDRRLFELFLQRYGLKMKSRAIEQNKLPDIVFVCQGEFYICELKTMKGSGGGQNKQIVEVAYFIKFSENDPRFHYLAFLDGAYANTLFNSQQPKIKAQRQDIERALNSNKQNYFVNTAGFKALAKDIFI